MNNEKRTPREGPSVLFYNPPDPPGGNGEDVSDDKVLRTLARHFSRDLVELFFSELAPDIDFTKSEFVNGKLFADFRKKGHVRPDFAVKLFTCGTDPELGIFHAEMEGRYLAAMEKRQKTYFHQIALEYGDPPVVSVVFFKEGGKKAVETHEVVRRLKAWESNRFFYKTVCLSRCRAEDYVGLAQPLAPALAALMSSETWGRVEQKLRCLEAVARLGVDDEKRYLLMSVIDIYLVLDEEEEVRFRQELNQGQREEVKKMVLTLQEAIEESKAQGMALGEVKEARKAVLLVVEYRWGTPPEDFVSKLEAIDNLGRLHQVMEQALKARALDEIDLGS